MFGVLAISACHARAAATSFDKWLENPFPPAAGFSLPFGDDGAATRIGESYGTGVQTGEEWNVRGDDTDHAQPVMAIATGKVVVARRFDDPWGRVVMIEHIVLDGHEKKRIRSQYAHLSRIDVHEGDIVRARKVIGAIGKQLHLEIRSDLDLPANDSPADHGYGADWIRRHYLDPSAFIRAHRAGFDPAAEPQLVLVDQAHYRMQYRVGGKVKREMEIGLGQERGQKRREGDLRTPKGIYFIVDKQKGKFGGEWAEFYGGFWIKVNYPGPTDAAWGLENGLIDQETASAIATAWSDRKLTPQNTPLGSGIGFHGWASEWDGGTGAHLSFGCVVMHTADIEAFYEDVPIGTMVVIF